MSDTSHHVRSEFQVHVRRADDNGAGTLIGSVHGTNPSYDRVAEEISYLLSGRAKDFAPEDTVSVTAPDGTRYGAERSLSAVMNHKSTQKAVSHAETGLPKPATALD